MIKSRKSFGVLAIRGAVSALTLLVWQTGSAWAQTGNPVEDFQSIVDSDATGPNASASGQAILDTCVTGANGGSEIEANRRFQADCDLLVANSSGDPQGVTGGLNSLAADQVSAQNAVSVRRNDSNLSVITQRMQLLRVASGISSYDQEELIAQNRLFEGMTGAGASADAGSSRLSAFINARYITGDEDDNKLQDGFDFDIWGVLVGMDYRFSDQFVGGLAVTYSDGESDYDKNRGELDSETWGGYLYGSYFLDSGLFFEGSVGYSSIDYDMTRTVAYQVDDDVISGVEQTAFQEMTSSPDGTLKSWSLGGGYTFNNEAWSFTPSLRFDSLKNDVDGYQERSTNLQTTGGAMALRVGSVDYESVTSNLGIQVARAISTSRGVIIPQGSVDWVHEFEDDTSTLRARYLNDINETAFRITTTDLDSDYYELSLGVSAQFAGGKSGFLSYRTLLDYDGLTYHAIEAGFRMEL